MVADGDGSIGDGTPPVATVDGTTPESADVVTVPLRESELWVEARAKHDASDIVARLARLMEQRGRSLPPFLEFYAVSRQAELGELSDTDAVRLLWLGQTGAALSPRAELVMLDRFWSGMPRICASCGGCAT
jgi:hypothetical protein